MSVIFGESWPGLPSLPASESGLRSEVRDFLLEESRSGHFEPIIDCNFSGYDPAFSRRLAARGFVGLNVPRNYGGAELSSVERLIVAEELLAAGAPVAAHWSTDRQAVPQLLRYGTEELRDYFLPRISRGECYFAIGLSEPDSGSDLASIRTRATPVDGGWHISGRKVWTSHADTAHFCTVLCRTSPRSDRRHAGMSQLIVDRRSKGLTIRPIRTLSGGHSLNELTFDEVFVSDNRVLGTIGDGWMQATSELAFERSGPERYLSTFALFVELVRNYRGSNSSLATLAVGRLLAQLTTARHLTYVVAGMIESGESPRVLSALAKDVGTQFEREVIDVSRSLSGARSTSDCSLQHLLDQATLSAPAFTIRGGATEILRSIVSKELQPS